MSKFSVRYSVQARIFMGRHIRSILGHFYVSNMVSQGQIEKTVSECMSLKNKLLFLLVILNVLLL